jgi:hypothetical protein
MKTLLQKRENFSWEYFLLQAIMAGGAKAVAEGAMAAAAIKARDNVLFIL